MEMAAAPRLPRIAQLHTLDSMRMKAMIGPKSAHFASDASVLYGCLCSCARVPLGRCR